MLNYSKVIVDVSNIFYRVAAFYLKNLDQDTVNNLVKSNTILNSYKNVIQNLKSQTLGDVYLLFDPLLSNGKLSERLRIKEGYKTNRDRKSPINQLKIDTLERLYSTYLVNAQSRVFVYHDCQYEADDYVEKLTESGNCLLVTADEDFCRYLEDGRVEMLIQGLSIKDDSIFTVKDFESKYGFKPTITTVTFWKAIFGDKSDNVVGSFKDPSTRVLRPASDEMMQIIKEAGEQNLDLYSLKMDFFAGQGRFTKLKEILQLSNTSCSYETLLNLTDENFKVIESMLPRNSDIDVDQFRVKLAFEAQPDVKKKFSLNGFKSKN